MVFGTAMVLIVPPFQVPDEPDHFVRAFQISEGHLVSTWEGGIGRGVLPISIIRILEPFGPVRYNKTTTSWTEIRDAMRIPLQPDIRAKYTLELAYYSPLPYLPQAIGIGIGRVMRWPPLVLMYMGRFCNLWAWIALGYLALRIAPGFGRPLLLLILMPMSLSVGTSLSADAITNGLAFVVTALAFNAAIKKSGTENPIISWRWVAAFVIGSAALTQPKAAYLPLAGLIFCVPAKRFGGLKRFATILLVLAIANASLLLLWERQTPGLNMITYLGHPDVSAHKQFDFLLGHPKTLLMLPIASAERDGLLIILSFVGRLGWLNIQVSPLFAVIYLLLLLIACRSSAESPMLANKWLVAVVSGAVVVAATEALLVLLDLVWTHVGSSRVDGLQGRYFIPIACALLMFVSAAWRCLPEKFQSNRSESSRNFLTTMIALVSCAYTIMLLYIHYYVSVGVGLV